MPVMVNASNHKILSSIAVFAFGGFAPMAGLLALCSLTGCAADDTAGNSAATNSAVTTLQIDKRVMDPPNAIFPLIFSAVTESEQAFTLANAVSVNGGSTKTGLPRLFYYWYWDLDPTKSWPGTFAVCNDDPTCTIAPCAKAKKINDIHTMLVVVATDRLKSSAKAPFDFAEDVKFDFVQWQLQIKGNCPGGA